MPKSTDNASKSVRDTGEDIPRNLKGYQMQQLRTVVGSSRAAIDLASIMVGIIVIGLIGGVIAATVFAVIPWAQDAAAKNQVSNIVTAENAHAGLSAENGTTRFAALTDSESPLAQSGLMKASDSGRYCAVATNDGEGYAVYVKSDSGKYFSAIDTKTAPYEVDASDADCLSDENAAPATECADYHGYGVYADTRVNCEWARGANLNDTYPNPEPSKCTAEAKKLGFLNTADAKRGFADACATSGWGAHQRDLMNSIEIGGTGALSSEPDYAVRAWQ